ncbi:MAG: phage tail protein [Desulfovibrio sp.]|jgi:hypothetical protein|nr:phage tail protein [Desulfovibrio sp.]
MRVGSLGDIVFETSASFVLTPGGLSKTRDARFEDHQVQGEKPQSEFLAPDLAGLEMSIRLRADLGVDPFKMADRLSLYCLQGRVLRLIVANRNMGKVTLRSVSQEWKYINPNGKGVQIIDLKLTMKEYV